MNCERFEDIAELYAAGEVAGAELAAAEAHLAQCAACRQQAHEARVRLRALGAALAPHRAADGFVERTMARVRAQVAPAEAERPESPRSRILRYAALAAAAALFVLAGYSFLRRGSMAWVENGTVALAGPTARRLGPASALAAGDLVATPPDHGATLLLAGGRLRVALAPASVVRITDPRTGTALQLIRGEAHCRGSASESTPMVASPLANVAAGPGAFSLRVAPEPAAHGAAAGTLVTLAAHEGAPRVVVLGKGAGAMPVESGQVLTLSSDQRRSLSKPIPIERLRQLLEAERRATMTRHGELELRWEALMQGRPEARRDGLAPLSRHASELQEALGQTRALHTRLQNDLNLLDRWQAEGKSAFRIVVQPIPPRR